MLNAKRRSEIFMKRKVFSFEMKAKDKYNVAKMNIGNNLI